MLCNVFSLVQVTTPNRKDIITTGQYTHTAGPLSLSLPLPLSISSPNHHHNKADEHYTTMQRLSKNTHTCMYMYTCHTFITCIFMGYYYMYMYSFYTCNELALLKCYMSHFYAFA